SSRRFTLTLLLAASVAATTSLAWAQTVTHRAPVAVAQPASTLSLPFPALPKGWVQAPEVAARSYVLQDMASQQTLAAHNADQPIEPASLTKLMTVYLVFQALQNGRLQLTQELPVSERAWRTGMTGASRSFIKLNSRVKVDDLIKGVIIQSGNDASVALAEGVGGTVENFVDMMNRQAKVFGLTASTFKNPEGLPAPGHVSTARELSVIAMRLISDYPQSLPYYSTKEYTYNGIRQQNRNLLLWRDPSVDGLKTGYTDAAGYCLITTAQRPSPAGPRRLLSVVIGAASSEARANESQKLLNWGYSAFDMVKLFDANQAVSKAPVWKGTVNEVGLGRSSPVVVLVPRGQGGSLQSTVKRNDPLLAPLNKGQAVGTLHVTLGGQALRDLPLQTLDAVPSAGWFGRLWDALRLSIQ